MIHSDIQFDVARGSMLATLDIPREQWSEDITETIRTLGGLLLVQEFPFKRGDFVLLRAEGLTRDDCSQVGRLALAATRLEAGEPMPLRSAMLHRLHILGVGPPYLAYFRAQRFRDLHDLRMEIGSPRAESPRGHFDDWPIHKYVSKASKLANQLKRRPTPADYNALAEGGEFPTFRVLREKISIRELHASIGFPDTRCMDSEDCIEFAADIVQANGVQKFGLPTISIIAARKRGPSYKTLLRPFDSWDDFKCQVLERVAQRQQIHQAKLERYRDMIPAEFFPQGLADNRLIRLGAKLELVNALAPSDWSEVQRIEVAAMRLRDLTQMLTKANHRLSDVYIEQEAIRLRLADDIWWPVQVAKKRLVVRNCELDAWRRNYQEKRGSRGKQTSPVQSRLAA